MPETSIIIRTYNEEKYLGNLLKAIREQDYKDYEVVVVDSGSNDKTVDIAKSFKAKVINIESRDFTFGYSLNIGCRNALGKYLVMVSAHTLPSDKNWLKNLTSPFSDNKVAMVYGRHLPMEYSKFSEKMDFKRLFKDSPWNSSVPLEYANNANAAIRKLLWEKKHFDEYLFGLEDIDWAKHITKEGYSVRYEPKAAIYHIHEEAWHQVFNRYRREAIAAVRIGLKNPPQARLGVHNLMWRLIDDTIRSFPNWSLERLEEILRFRYYQWKGSRRGWYKDKHLDLERDKQELFFQDSNEAVLIEGENRARFTEVPLEELRPGYVLLKVDYVGVCRTDIEVYEGTLGYYRDGLAKYPITPGHEFSGTIVRVGANNKYREWWKPGDRVVGECILSRGEDGQRKEVGVINYNGAYARFVIMPGDAIHRIPDKLDSKVAVLAEPLGVVLRALRRIEDRLKNAKTVAVIGAGPIGNLCAQTLAVSGYEVTVYDKSSDRLKFLSDDFKKENDITGLEKFDIIIEITGSKEVLDIVLNDSKFDGTLLLLGFPYGETRYNFENVVGNEKVIVGSVGAEKKDFPESLKLLSKLDTQSFTETVLPLKDFKKAWEMQKESKHLKILLKP